MVVWLHGTTILPLLSYYHTLLLSYYYFSISVRREYFGEEVEEGAEGKECFVAQVEEIGGGDFLVAEVAHGVELLVAKQVDVGVVFVEAFGSGF